jgi:DNA (cytosine-5)-methyltransferase 1
MSDRDRADADLQPHRIECIEHWNELMAALPDPDVTLPSFPIWSDEFGATYPFMEMTPYYCDEPTLRAHLNGKAEDPTLTHKDLLNLLPSYARTEEFPRWKQRYIQQNREWFEQHRYRISEHWLNKLRTFCSSHRKLEWNCQGAERDLWQHILQFRPSGIRVRRFDRSPALVAMTAVQVPIFGPYRRFMTRTEGLRLQGFPDGHKLPLSREAAFRALGNTVHVEVVKAIVKSFLQPSSPETEAQMQIGTDITLGSPINAPSLVTNSGANHGNGTYTHSEECQHTT